ncbi:hypothetical protein ACQP1K_07970 [Sphaerimonospora sp. CA-214678]|uniref:hypothetical protein n=1 Tax=Sphaerimonospora sp. CA-214678 TaxID=3240029 RepID=UPI003D8A7728
MITSVIMGPLLSFLLAHGVGDVAALGQFRPDPGGHFGGGPGSFPKGSLAIRVDDT